MELDVEADSVIIHSKREVVGMLEPHEYRALRDLIKSHDWFIESQLKTEPQKEVE